MRIRLWLVLFLVAVLTGLVVVWSGSADAAEHDYRVAWDPNDPDERVDRYAVTVTSSTANTYTAETTGEPPDDPPATEVSLTIDEPIGESLTFTAIACRGDLCSDPSEPVLHQVEPKGLTPPTGIKIVTVNVTVEVAQ